jgi:threonine dehydrogenase-like Zn-dependent dehydrogenase
MRGNLQVRFLGGGEAATPSCYPTTVRSAQQHGQAYMDRLLAHAQKGELNPAYLATHRFSLEDGPRGYDMFKHKKDGCVRAVFAP